MRSPGNPLGLMDTAPAFKGRDHTHRYDPYRDANIGNLRFIGQKQESPKRVGAFALF